ncbi:MAG: VanW family protein [Syntrophomonadaceae bacterium]|nr:VanW family protein [Syntrophomonadaceae bacterium]
MSPDSPEREHGNGGRAQIKLWLIPVVIAALVFCVLSFVLCIPLYSQDALLPGITVNDTDVSQLSTEQAEELLRSVAARSVEAEVQFRYDDYIMDAGLGELLAIGDVSAALEPVWQQEAELNLWQRCGAMYLNKTRHYDVSLWAANAARQAELAAEWNARWGQDLIEPQMVMELGKVSIIPGQNGIKVATGATFDPLFSCLGSTDKQVLPIVFEETAPQEDERGLHNIVELASCTTKFKEREINRSANLRLAAEQINGVALEPGEVFSFNERVGKRTWEAGYRNALVVIGSKFEPELGGGICQVSSTLYDAVLMSGLEIVERTNHGLPVAYIPLGLDATVYWGAQDFKFRNSNDNPVYIGVFSEKGKGELTICIYGHRSEKKNIKLRNIVYSYIPYTTQLQLDPELEPGTVIVDNAGGSGARAQGFIDIYDESGEVLVETIALSKDYYRPSPRILIVGMNPDGSDPMVVGLPSGEGAPEPEADGAVLPAPEESDTPGESNTTPEKPGGTEPAPTSNTEGAEPTIPDLEPAEPQDPENDEVSDPEGPEEKPEGLPEPL